MCRLGSVSRVCQPRRYKPSSPGRLPPAPASCLPGSPRSPASKPEPSAPWLSADPLPQPPEPPPCSPPPPICSFCSSRPPSLICQRPERLQDAGQTHDEESKWFKARWSLEVRVSGNTTVSRLTHSSSAIERRLFLSSGCEKREIPAALAVSRSEMLRA